jgi:serine/threonine-protein kinase RsbW
VRIPSDVRYIERVVEIVRRHCEEMGFTRSQLALNIPVALTEAVSNAILRGNREDPEKFVHVRALVSHARLIVDVRDEGRGFDLSAALSDPTRPENLEREDGRGLYLMRQLMHRVERLDGPTNTVRLVLQRD